MLDVNNLEPVLTLRVCCMHPHNILICIEVFKLARSAEVHLPINLTTTEDEHNEHEERITCQQILHLH